MLLLYFAANYVCTVPGFLGSVLQAQLNRTSVVAPQCPLQTDAPFTIWVNQSQFTVDNTPCFVDNMKLTIDPTTLQFSSVPGVSIQPISGFGNVSTSTKAVEFADPTNNNTAYMEPLIQYLEKQGYVRGQNITAAPYDWRFVPFLDAADAYFSNLKNLIENLSSKYSGSKVCLVSHSMG
jgi:hypothetical protein